MGEQMPIAFCSRCNHLLDAASPACPFCAAPLSETDEVIARRAHEVLGHTTLASRRTVDARAGSRRQRLLRS
jgi:predicted amidophosphoribosyltransferase